MINDLDETIKAILTVGVPLDPSEVDVVFDAPSGEWSTSLSRPTINCYLYHVVENTELRIHDWKVTRQQSQNGSDSSHPVGSRRKIPLRVDMCYMITTWASVIEDEHSLLWRSLAALARHGVLPEEHLKGSLAEQEYSMPVKVAQPEGVFKNPSDFWSGMDSHIKPTLSVIITVPLDLDRVTESPLVLTRRLFMRPPVWSQPAYELPLAQFGGWVRSGDGDDAQPVSGAEVVIVERGQRAQTDDEGKFKFNNVPRGNYTLQATHAGGEAQRTIEVPGEEYDLVLSGHREGKAAKREKGSKDEEQPPSQQSSTQKGGRRR